ncbi:hypothetical protein AX774_g8146 [Zancudomyces culisetae]|uniref:Uncharacterized protein n=1 Tax=Zancudomyces culisetae TaxID=1213189 RepID=A0A1R1PC68_ZANCU|nr:hypothetical protein AX774_g8146 [Zancudomyces culisetae]|eukprot:OMH78462.1 hypothetical protein AX774_g8146 [Zancudomyces culisetae]
MTLVLVQVLLKQSQCTIDPALAVLGISCCSCSTTIDVGCNVVNLGAVFVRYNASRCRPCVCPQDYTIFVNQAYNRGTSLCEFGF